VAEEPRLGLVIILLPPMVEHLVPVQVLKRAVRKPVLLPSMEDGVPGHLALLVMLEPERELVLIQLLLEVVLVV
jgi:hypothetical protein